MKLKYIALAFISVSVLISCSKTASEDGIENTQDSNVWIWDETLPVPVRFASPEMTTKAVMTSLAGEKIGVLGLSYGTGNWATNSENAVTLIPNDWGANSYGYNIDENGYVQLDNKFYPMDNAENFAFFGYYPASSANAGWVTIENGATYNVRYIINGTTDILYAQCKAQEYTPIDGTGALQGFNARYIRKINQDGLAETYAPKLIFNHVLTRIDFSIKAAEADAGIEISALKILNPVTQATLVLASKDNQASEGTFVSQTTESDINVQYQQLGTFELLLTEYPVALDPVMLLPAAQYNCVLVYSNGVESPEFEVSLPEPVSGETRAGKCYAVTLSVLSPVEVSIATELTEWGEPIEVGEIPVG